MTGTASLTLYELAGTDPALRFSPHCWKVRMALAHKGLEAEGLPWRFTEKDRIAFSGQGLVPVLMDGATVVSDSWRIALHLDERFPDRPALFGSPEAVPLARFVNGWADTTLMLAIARLILTDIADLLGPEDLAYFRRTRENRFGMTLEAVVADRPAHLARLREALAPLRALLKGQDFIAGATPAYADHCVFGMFMWARCASPVDLLAAEDVDDPVVAWRERMLDAFGGLARRAPARAA